MTPQKTFEPFIPSSVQMLEFTARAVITGVILGIVFGASSLYLVLKVGLTVSASIPVAVISLAMFRAWSKAGGRDSTILENNITQTAGSAGESIAFGVGVTMPAILILGFDLELTRVMLVALLGGLLGILMMIPLRRALIVKEHGILKYPEGTACAAVLKAGANADSAATNLRTVIDLLPLACAGFSPAKNAQHQILYLIEESTCNRDVMVCMANEAARMRVTEAEGAVFVRLFVCPSRVLR